MGGISSVIVGNTKAEVMRNARKFYDTTFRQEEMYPRVDTSDFPSRYDYKANGFTKILIDGIVGTAVIKIQLTTELETLGYVRLSDEHKKFKYCAWVSVHS